MGKIFCLNTGALEVNTFIAEISEHLVFIVDPAACDETGDENLITGWLNQNKKIPVGIFLTHGHFDHITGIPAIKNIFPNCTVAVHKDDICMFDKSHAYSSYQMVRDFGIRSMVSAVEKLEMPETTFSGGETLDKIFSVSEKLCGNSGCNAAGVAAGSAIDLSAEEISSAKENLASWKIIHTPGHSLGSCCVYSAKEKSLISGDTLFYRSWGRTDLAGGNEVDIYKSLELLRTTLPPDTKVYPGHDRYGFLLSES